MKSPLNIIGSSCITLYRYGMLFYYGLPLILFSANLLSQIALASDKNDAAIDREGSVTIKAIERAPRIDGVISEGEWEGSSKIDLLYQVQPGDNIKPSEQTEVYIAYDKQHLYILFRAFDSDPTGLRARVVRRDDLFNDDYVSVYLDTFDDRRRAYVLYFNPLGIQADGIITEGNLGTASEIKDLTWDGIFESKGSLNENGYLVEVAIPFKTLRFQSGKNRRWGFHAQRWIARKAERVHWQPISRDRSELLAQMGSIDGLEEVFAGRTLDLTPTLTGSINGEREKGTDGIGRLNSVNRLEPGLTAIYSITPNLTISAAINPDFSQIEADVPQIDVNQRFPLFFPERRPFFLEGNELFRSTGSLTFVNTRQIVDPDWGLKLTGKVGKNSIGLLSASDRAPGLRYSSNQPPFGKNAQFTIARYQRDLLKDSKIGLFVTDHRFAGTRNTVLSTDGQLRFSSVNTLGFQLSQSNTKDRDAHSSRGSATYSWYEHRGRHWRLNVADWRVSKDYQSRTGFIRRNGFSANTGNFGYEFQAKERAWWVNVRPFLAIRRLKTDAKLLDESYIDPGLDITLARGIELYIYKSWHKDSFNNREFPYKFNHVYYLVNTFKRVAFEGFMQWGEGVNFDPNRPGIGNAWDSQLKIVFKPNDRLNTELLHIKSKLNDKQSGIRLFNQDLIRSRTTYQFTRNNAIRAILDYDTSKRQAGVSLLYAYTPKPNTALYVGYNDLIFNGIDPLNNLRSPGLFNLRRTFYTKLSYNFRF
jgi:hypothetical protein